MADERKRGHKLRGWAVLGLGILALVGVVAVVGHLGEGKHFLEIAQNAQPAWLILAVALQVATYACEAGVWYGALRKHGVKLPFRELYGISVVALLTSQVVPTAGVSGQLLVVRALEGKDVPHPQAMGVILLDMVGYYLAYALSVAIALAVLSLHGGVPTWILVMAAALVGIALLLGGGSLYLSSPGRKVPGWTSKIKPLRRAVESLTSADPSLLRTPALLAWATVLRFGNFALDATTVWVCLRAVGQTTGIFPAAAALVVASLARTVGVVPGGLGTFEGASVAALSLFGVGVEAGLAATLLFRGFSFWLPMIPGLWLGKRVGEAAAQPA